MIELFRVALNVSVVGLLGPLGVGWLCDAVLTARGLSRPTLGMVYWIGLMGLGALIVVGHGLGVPQTLVLSVVTLVAAGGWMWALATRRWRSGNEVRHVLPLLPLGMVGIVYCVLDPVRIWDSYLIWLARVRLLEEWVPLSRFGDLGIVFPEYPFLGAAAWWWTDRVARVPVEAGRVVFVFAYLAFCLAVLTHAGHVRSNRFQAFWVFLAYTYLSFDVVTGYQDGFLMVSMGMVALAFLHWGHRGVVWIPPLAAGLSLVKAEGAVLGSILVFCWFVSRPWQSPTSDGSRLDLRSVLVGCLGFALIMALWPWLEIRNGLNPTHVQGDAFDIQSLGSVLGQVDRIPAILRKIALYYASVPWITIPFLAAFACATLSAERLDRQRRFLLSVVTLHVTFVIAVFWLTQLPFEWHLGAASHRLLLQGRLVLMLFVYETAMRQWAPLFESQRTTDLGGRVSAVEAS